MSILALCVGVTTASAQASYKVATSSGGTWSKAGVAGGGTSGPYSPDGSESSPRGKTVPTGAGQWTLGGPGTASCTGTITITFEWDPAGTGQPPPEAVVLKETSTAQWIGTTGSCSNGLGNAPTAIPNGQSSTGVKYTVKNNPGSSFTVTCSPSASTSYPDPPVDGPQAGTASVWYSCKVYPVRILLGGSVQHGGTPSLLIGQRLVASLDIGDLPVTGITYNWSASSNAFANYVIAPDSSSATFTPMPASVQSPTMTCYAKRDGVLTVSCVFASNNPSLAITLSKNVTCVKPNLVIDEESVGQFYMGTGSSLSVINPDWMRLLLFNPNRSGMTVVAKVTDPGPPFTSAASKGTWAYVQTVKPEWSYVRTDGTSYVSDENGKWWLDGSFPYPIVGGPFWADPQQSWQFGDSPGAGSLSIASWLSYKADFSLFVMYLPPGQESKWVPLRRTGWSCKGVVQRDRLIGVVNGQEIWEWIFVENSAGINATVDSPNHPSWVRVRIVG